CVLEVINPILTRGERREKAATSLTFTPIALPTAFNSRDLKCGLTVCVCEARFVVDEEGNEERRGCGEEKL
ncbi:hypothetical protein Pcinc_017973, partial [Petrolisthes cinctipes]